MKRTFFCFLVLCLTLSMSACGVSQTEYDALLEEKSSLQSEVESLQSEVESLSTKNESLSDENESLSATAQSLLDEKTERVLAELNDSYGKAWVTTSFGDDSICFTDGGSHLQCISGRTYDISEDGISALWSDYVESVKLLGATNSITEKINYEYISVKFLNPSGTYILDLTLKKTGEKYILDAIMCNAIHSTQIIPILNSLGSK